MRADIVLGLGYGDEGKGSVVDSLIADPDDTLVVRFGGGHQVGHTVIHNGYKHIFSNFGSGTLQGVPTYWSKYCTMDPNGFEKEKELLIDNEIVIPEIYVDPKTMITTPWDILHNKTHDTIHQHGSVGVGFGATIERNEAHVHLYYGDLFHEEVLDFKLQQIRHYYYSMYGSEFFIPIGEFRENCIKMRDFTTISKKEPLFDVYEHIIFEGHQGILLDKEYGFFPHVTRSSTTCKYALKLLEGRSEDINIYYVSRSYQTRHGNGPMNRRLSDKDLKRVENLGEINISEFAGEFRKGYLTNDMINYAIRVNDGELPAYYGADISQFIIFTHMDKTDNKLLIDGTLNLPPFVSIRKRMDYRQYNTNEL